jgi:ERCC4-type nuclease
MVSVDYRTGSKELLPLFPNNTAQIATLPFGDFSFIGNGPNDTPMNIGIERKRIAEIAADIGNGRFISHQLPGLINEYSVSYLIVEGLWRADANDYLQEWTKGRWFNISHGRKQYLASSIRKFLSTVENIGGLRLRLTRDQRDTVAEVVALYQWWTSKEWTEHRSHIKCRYPEVDAVLFRKPSLLQRWAAELPGVGWKRSKAAERYFNSPLELALGTVDDWRRVEGVGKGTAQRVVDEIQKGRQ